MPGKRAVLRTTSACRRCQILTPNSMATAWTTTYHEKVTAPAGHAQDAAPGARPARLVSSGATTVAVDTLVPPEISWRHQTGDKRERGQKPRRLEHTVPAGCSERGTLKFLPVTVQILVFLPNRVSKLGLVASHANHARSRCRVIRGSWENVASLQGTRGVRDTP
jgi:hypothetical protein